MEVLLAKRSMSVLRSVSMLPLLPMNSRKYLEVSFCRLKAVITVGTFNSSVSLSSQVLSVAGVLLSKIQESIDGLLVCVVWLVEVHQICN